MFPIDEPSNYEKVKLPEMPTSFHSYENYLYFGLNSGTIIVYNTVTKMTLHTFQ
jgi:hypothetical protein